MDHSAIHQSIAARRCAVCGVTLNVHEQTRGTTCSRAECRNQQIREQVQFESRRKANLERRALQVEASVLGERQSDEDDKRILAVVPSNDRPLVALNKDEIRSFVDRLGGIVSRAAEVRLGNRAPDPESSYYDDPREISEKHLAILGHGCAVCRGHCCTQGQGHAFIKVSTILNFMDQHPELRPREVLHEYVSRIGYRAYENSCVYHDQHGCRLRRDMRSEVCNGYLCDGLTDALDRLDSGSEEQVFVVAVGDYHASECDEPDRTYARPGTVNAESFTIHEETHVSGDASKGLERTSRPEPAGPAFKGLPGE